MEEVHIEGFFTSEENRTPDQITAIKDSDEAVSELQEAEIIKALKSVNTYSFTDQTTRDENEMKVEVWSDIV